MDPGVFVHLDGLRTGEKSFILEGEFTSLEGDRQKKREEYGR